MSGELSAIKGNFAAAMANAEITIMYGTKRDFGT
jgi:hypothetical protein